MSNAFARAQSRFDQLLPIDTSVEDALVAARTEHIAADMWQDLEYLSDAFNDAACKIGTYRNKHMSEPGTVEFLSMCRDDTDHCEIGKRVVEAMRAYIKATAYDQALEERS